MKKNPLKIPCSGGIFQKIIAKYPTYGYMQKNCPKIPRFPNKIGVFWRQFFYIDTHHQLNCYLKHELLHIAC